MQIWQIDIHRKESLGTPVERNRSYLSFSMLWVVRFNGKYSRTPLTRTLKGNENLFELAGFRVIGVD